MEIFWVSTAKFLTVKKQNACVVFINFQVRLVRGKRLHYTCRCWLIASRFPGQSKHETINRCFYPPAFTSTWVCWRLSPTQWNHIFLVLRVLLHACKQFETHLLSLWKRLEARNESFVGENKLKGWRQFYFLTSSKPPALWGEVMFLAGDMRCNVRVWNLPSSQEKYTRTH